MAEAPAFELVSGELERGSHLDRLEARGTVRLALKAAGLSPRTVTPPQMAVVLEKTLPGELAARGVSESDALCANITVRLRALPSAPADETPDAIFQRLGRR